MDELKPVPAHANGISDHGSAETQMKSVSLVVLIFLFITFAMHLDIHYI